MPNNQQRRRQLIKQRRHIPDQQRRAFSQAITRHFWQSPRLSHAQRIAIYLDIRGEAPTQSLIRSLLRKQRRIFLPSLNLQRKGFMRFYRYHGAQSLQSNRYGILEPKPHAADFRPSQQFDLVILPLVGVDRFGNRLGMGGGYYDRHFAYRRHRKQPFLLGLAYDFQRSRTLYPDRWDIPVDAVLTERGLVLC